MTRKGGSVEHLPAAGEGKRGEEGHLGYLLRQASGAYRLKLERAFADLGVTPPQFAVLTMIVAYPGISGAEIARLAVLTPQTVSVIVGNLLRAGWIERTAHEVHGRIQRLEATASGRKVLARCRARVVTIDRRLLEGIGAAEERTIRRWLVAVALAGEEPGSSRRGARGRPVRG